MVAPFQRFASLLVVIPLAVILATCGIDFPRAVRAEEALASGAESDYEIAVYYFPNYHVDPRNELLHGKGWTE